jgi:ketosteroid isomerase-like protein
MSQENVEIVRQMLAAWVSGDRDAARTAYDENVVWVVPVIDASVSHGVPEMEQAVEAWRRSCDDYAFEIQELMEGGDHVIAVIRQFGRGKESGTEVDLTSALLFTLLASKIVRMEAFETREQALEAAGLSESANTAAPAS